jgi:hypothetical protein
VSNSLSANDPSNKGPIESALKTYASTSYLYKEASIFLLVLLSSFLFFPFSRELTGTLRRVGCPAGRARPSLPGGRVLASTAPGSGGGSPWRPESRATAACPKDRPAKLGRYVRRAVPASKEELQRKMSCLCYKCAVSGSVTESIGRTVSFWVVVAQFLSEEQTAGKTPEEAVVHDRRRDSTLSEYFTRLCRFLKIFCFVWLC